MQPVNEWLDEYGESHQNATNKFLHWICVPLIVLSLVGLLWSAPVPAVFEQVSPLMNWGTLFMLAALVYYFIMSFTLAIGMVFVTGAMVALLVWMDGLNVPLWQLSIGIFVVAWIGQFIGHAIEGKRPSFFKDLQFLMIGPIWLLSALYRKVGIPL
ncbi:MAG: DUF962 domain-containing protein [Gammaproteobacteria bacterium]|nr:DUF962 domain-containing protein [Gammaproteobacteria bacterium]NND61025.1 DUF962 domain-containing protein [Gammaproteobacteria bacterium]